MRLLGKEALVMGGSILFFFVSLHAYSPWTWLFRKEFSLSELETMAKSKSAIILKENLPRFTQLLFCWNAHRPTQGFFRFFVQVRDARTGKWHAWHKMAEWGAVNWQRSYLHKGDFSSYYHVRLELPADAVSNAFRIKVEAEGGAEFAFLKGIAVTIADFTRFDADQIGKEFNAPSFIIKNVPQYSQMVLDHPKASVMCSPTSCGMLLAYLKSEPFDVVTFALKSYDHGLDTFGSWPFNMAQAFDELGGDIWFTVTRLNSFSELYRRLQKNIPVVVSVRGALPGAPKQYENGHLILVVGWNQERGAVVCHDPAFPLNEEVLTYYSLHDFCSAWAASHCLSYLAEKRFS